MNRSRSAFSHIQMLEETPNVFYCSRSNEDNEECNRCNRPIVEGSDDYYDSKYDKINNLWYCSDCSDCSDCSECPKEAWQVFGEQAPSGQNNRAIYLGHDIISPESSWVAVDRPPLSDAIPELYLNGEVKKDRTLITWRGVALTDSPPEDFLKRKDRYLIVPDAGITLSFTRGAHGWEPTITPEQVALLAYLNGCTPAKLGEHVVFHEREPVSDVEALDMSYFHTPRLFL
jgi:hypothetical protein